MQSAKKDYTVKSVSWKDGSPEKSLYGSVWSEDAITDNVVFDSSTHWSVFKHIFVHML